MDCKPSFDLYALPKDLFKQVFSFCNEKTFELMLENYTLPRLILMHSKYDHDEAIECLATIGDLPSVQILLHFQSTQYIIDKTLLIASYYGKLDVVKYLVSIGANIHKNGNDNSALYNATRNGHLEMIQYLVSMGADIHSDNDYTLRCAATKGFLNVVQYLVSIGANIHAYDDYALRYAAGNGHLEVVKYLVSVGADMNCWSRYDPRRWVRHARVVRYLVSLQNSLIK